MLHLIHLQSWLRARFTDTERAASLVEYALLVALIALVCIIAIRALGQSVSSEFNTMARELSAA